MLFAYYRNHCNQYICITPLKQSRKQLLSENQGFQYLALKSTKARCMPWEMGKENKYKNISENGCSPSPPTPKCFGLCCEYLRTQTVTNTKLYRLQVTTNYKNCLDAMFLSTLKYNCILSSIKCLFP